MGRSKFYPHEKTLYDLRLKQSEIPTSIQNKIEIWKEKKIKKGYHMEYVEESTQIAASISEWSENPELFEVMEEVENNESILNHSENNENFEEETELDELIEEFENQQNSKNSETITKETDKELESLHNNINEMVDDLISDDDVEEEIAENSESITKELGLFVPVDIRERLPENLLSFRNGLNSIEKTCFDLMFEAHEARKIDNYFTLADFEEKGIVKLFSDFSKYKGYKGRYYDIKRLQRHPNYIYQIIPKHSLKSDSIALVA